MAWRLKDLFNLLLSITFIIFIFLSFIPSLVLVDKPFVQSLGILQSYLCVTYKKSQRNQCCLVQDSRKKLGWL
ncbi:hypothetical protein HanXRQr2_Chr17g0780101 [Helianthus annuus]|uniref:Uncharacterized protein n=1 Tax=Helianthus annuus TaxID=4232 RepID=A0A251RQ27_HELAN|nr:hypothetical protein HanXRQr2_Chr17g0780101 [Helianthus annuus]KAJ0811229.1 hypothetical protein HanPSC8_Chr17g0748451 [Helianthus annuus]